MDTIDTLIQARWIVPVEPDQTVLHHYSLAIHEGRIHDILPTREASKKYTSINAVDLPGHALIPGLINAHGHSPMTLFRGLADDLPLMTWLNDHIWPAEMKWVNSAFVRDGSRLAIAEMIKSGTTCFCDMYFCPEDTAQVARETGIRAAIGMIMIDFPSPYAQSADEYLNKGLQLHDDFRTSNLIHTLFAPHAPYTVSVDSLKKIQTFSDELDLNIVMHVHETAHEVEESVKKNNCRPLQLLADLDLVNSRLLAVHMTQLEDEEIELLANQGANIIHCPESNLKLASGFCPADKLLQTGVNVALGTDGAASNNDLDMLGEMRTAALLAKGVSQDATSLPAHTALRMATLNGARALGLNEKTGSLEIGKSADITAIELSDIASQPVYDPISQIVYTANRHQVSDVWVEGKRLLDSGQLTTIDEQSILENAIAWRDKIAGYDEERIKEHKSAQ